MGEVRIDYVQSFNREKIERRQRLEYNIINSVHLKQTECENVDWVQVYKNPSGSGVL
jgi:hypothetical protein